MSNPNLTDAERRVLESAAKPTDARPSIPIAAAAWCVDCDVVFDMASPCPKCGSELSWFPVSSNRAAERIKSLTDQLDEAESVLVTIAKRHLGVSSALAAKEVERIRDRRSPQTKTPTVVKIAGVVPS